MGTVHGLHVCTLEGALADWWRSSLRSSLQSQKDQRRLPTTATDLLLLSPKVLEIMQAKAILMLNAHSWVGIFVDLWKIITKHNYYCFGIHSMFTTGPWYD